MPTAPERVGVATACLPGLRLSGTHVNRNVGRSAANRIAEILAAPDETLPSESLAREASEGPERRGNVASPQVDRVRHQGLEPRTR